MYPDAWIIAFDFFKYGYFYYLKGWNDLYREWCNNLTCQKQIQN